MCYIHLAWNVVLVFIDPESLINLLNIMRKKGKENKKKKKIT